MNSWAAAVFGSTLTFITLTLLTTSGRFYARRSNNHGYGLDDWIILFDTVLATGLAVMMMWACEGAGIGLSPEEETPNIAIRYLKVTWANELIITPIIGTVKIAVLLFYKRIFITTEFRTVANVFIALSACWTIAFTCTLAFNLIPFDLEWALTSTRDHNLNFGAMLVSMGALDLVLDVCILSLPVFVIKKLNLSTKRQLVVIGLLWTGAFCIVASAIRLFYITKFLKVEGTGDDFAGVTAQISLWSTIEPLASLVAASLPTLGPLFRQNEGLHWLFTHIRSTLTRFTSRARSGLSKSSNASSYSTADSDKHTTGLIWHELDNTDAVVTTIGQGAVAPDASDPGIRVYESFSSEIASAKHSTKAMEKVV